MLPPYVVSPSTCADRHYNEKKRLYEPDEEFEYVNLEDEFKTRMTWNKVKSVRRSRSLAILIGAFCLSVIIAIGICIIAAETGLLDGASNTKKSAGISTNPKASCFVPHGSLMDCGKTKAVPVDIWVRSDDPLATLAPITDHPRLPTKGVAATTGTTLMYARATDKPITVLHGPLGQEMPWWVGHDPSFVGNDPELVSQAPYVDSESRHPLITPTSTADNLAARTVVDVAVGERTALVFDEKYVFLGKAEASNLTSRDVEGVAWSAVSLPTALARTRCSLRPFHSVDFPTPIAISVVALSAVAIGGSIGVSIVGMIGMSIIIPMRTRTAALFVIVLAVSLTVHLLVGVLLVASTVTVLIRG